MDLLCPAFYSQLIDTGKPVLTSAAIQQAEETDDTEDDCESGESDTDSSEAGTAEPVGSVGS